MRNSNGIVNTRTYRLLKDKFPINPKTNNSFTYKEWVEIMQACFKTIANQVIDDTQGFTFDPYYLGTIQVVKYKQKKQPVSGVKSIILKRIVRHANIHSFKYAFMIEWKNATFESNKVYVFKTVRQNFRWKLANKIIEGKQDYDTRQVRKYIQE